jgi:hypothetical protein
VLETVSAARVFVGKKKRAGPGLWWDKLRTSSKLSIVGSRTCRECGFCGGCGFCVRLFGVKNRLGEKNRRKNRKNRENLRLECQGWCREDAERLDRGEARGGKWTATRLRPAGYGGQAGCQWGSENRNPPAPVRPAGELEKRKMASKEVAVYEGDSGVERTPGQVKRIKSKVANDLHRKVSMSRMRLPAAPWASPGDQ